VPAAAARSCAGGLSPGRAAGCSGDLIQPGLSQGAEILSVQLVSAGVEPQKRLGVKPAGGPEEFQGLVRVEQRLAPSGRCAPACVQGCGLLQLGFQVALVFEEMGVSLLVRVEAEVAVPVAAQRNEESFAVFRGPARQAGRGDVLQTRLLRRCAPGSPWPAGVSACTPGLSARSGFEIQTDPADLPQEVLGYLDVALRVLAEAGFWISSRLF